MLRYWRAEWWRWNGSHYTRVSDAQFRAEVTQFLCEYFRKNKVPDDQGDIHQVTASIVTNVVQALQGLTLVPDAIEQQTWLGSKEGGNFVAMANGLVNVDEVLDDSRPVSLRPHSSEWFSCYSLPYQFNPSARCPRWLKFLDEVLEGDRERIALVQEWFGYCLTADISQQKFFVLEGEGGNGKGVTEEVLVGLVGEDNCGHLPLELLDSQFGPSVLLGKLVNFSSEAEGVSAKAEAWLKNFVGGNKVVVNQKFKALVNVRPTARLVISTNNRPDFKDSSSGLWRRMLLLPFRVTIPEEAQDKTLADKLKLELSGIFNWSVEGLRRLRQQGRFTVPSISRQALQQYRTEVNPARTFLLEHCEEGEGGIPCQDLYRTYREWCEERGYKPLTDGQFGKQVRRTFTTVTRDRRTSGGREYEYRGLVYSACGQPLASVIWQRDGEHEAAPM